MVLIKTAVQFSGTKTSGMGIQKNVLKENRTNGNIVKHISKIKYPGCKEACMNITTSME